MVDQKRNLSLRMQGADVTNLQKGLKMLGFTIEDKEGFFGKSTKLAIQEFQKQHGLEPTGIADSKTAPLITAAAEAPVGEGIATFQVTGKVASRVSAGVAKLRIEIVDKGVGGDFNLTEAFTDESGVYEASFTHDDLLKRGKVQPDLQARAYADKTFLAASDVHYNSSISETLNILLDDTLVSTLQSEHKTLTDAISVHFKGNLSTLQETDAQQDITYLANKTGWDARAVALASLADQFSAGTVDKGNPQIEPAFFYALFRAGLPANEAALYNIDPATAEAIWNQGIAQGVIPAALKENVQKAKENFTVLAAQRVLNMPATIGVSTLTDMLVVSRIPKEKQGLFADTYTRCRGDLPQFWKAVQGSFGEETAKGLKLDGQLAYLTLNNASLISNLHKNSAKGRINDTLELVDGGYHLVGTWRKLIDGDPKLSISPVPIPPEITGADDKEKRSRYAEMLAAQVRLSYPTAVVAQMVKNGDTPLAGKPFKEMPLPDKQASEKYLPVTLPLKDRTYNFLASQQGKFEIGMQPVAQYVALNKDVQIETDVHQEIARIQRVYNITPDHDAMNALLRKGVDSACAVVRYDRDEFVQMFKDDVGGDMNARLIHAKSQQVHNTALNIAVSYVTARTASGDGGYCPAQILPNPVDPNSHAAGIIAYPTLENLFGAMDYCDCADCRSILSPAAYLVDLLQFIDKPTNYGNNPLDVLLGRRHEIQYLPLTCENTNMPLPYIDLVNETLEWYITNSLSLAAYEGYTTDSTTTPEELLANPQYVRDTAYDILAGKPLSTPPLLPPKPPLPFHQPLENLRRYFNKFEAPLPRVMEALRKNDSIERLTDSDYGWRDILMEELCLSRQEYRLLTDHTLTLQELYGYLSTTAINDVRTDLSNAKTFTRITGISYVDLVEILKTRFVNPNSTLIPKLERLGVPFSALQRFRDNQMTEASFLATLAPHVDASQYGGNIITWVKDDTNYANIMSLITLTNPAGSDDVCSFDKLEFRYVDPAKLQSCISDFEFVRLIRFIRLWKKLGWTIEQTDKAITALYPADQIPSMPNVESNLQVDRTIAPPPHPVDNMQKLENGFLVLLPRLGVIKRVMEALNLTVPKDLLPLLACFAPIDTHGDACLYRQMFLGAALKQDPVFADDGYGNFLLPGSTVDRTISPGNKLIAHADTLRAAFNLADSELSQIVGALGYNMNTPLNVETISAVFRRGWLARKLKLSIREFLLLTRFTGIDPFAAPDPAYPPITRLIELVNSIRAASLKPTEALYLIWNQDISGKSSPEDGEISDFSRTLRSALAAVETEFAVSDDPDGQITRSLMTLVYGNDATDLFFGLLGNTLVTSVPYSRVLSTLVTSVTYLHTQATLVTSVPYKHHQATLEQSIVNAAAPGLIAYDDSKKLLSYTGVLSTTTCAALKAAAAAEPEITFSSQQKIDFNTAVDDLYAENQRIIQAKLEQPIVDAAPGLIAYDDTKKLLSFTGAMNASIRDALKVAAISAFSTQEAVDTFNVAASNLYEENQKVIKANLEQSIVDAAQGRIIYDDARKLLSLAGVLSVAAFLAVTTAVGATPEFVTAVGSLNAKNQKVVGQFFVRFPELQQYYDAFTNSSETEEKKLSALLTNFLPELKRRSKRQQALQAISAVAKVDASFSGAVLNDATVLHAMGDNGLPALDDLTALGITGLTAKFFFRDMIPDPMPDLADITHPAEANLSYTATGSNKLPANASNSLAAISGIWSGYLEAPENGLYKLNIEVDTGAIVTLYLDGTLVTLDSNASTNPNDNIWNNHDSIEFQAGRLYTISLKVEKFKDTLIVSWWTAGRGRETIPAQYLYSAILTDHLRQVYVRFLKAAALATVLKLTANEIAYLASNADYKIINECWLNCLPSSGSPDITTSTALLNVLIALLDFACIKAALSPRDERLLTVLKDPAAVTPNGDSLLLTLTRWELASLDVLLIRFNNVIANNADHNALTHLYTFCRVYDAYAWVKKLGIQASALINAATNEPTAATVRDLQSALRARYDSSDWLNILKPINDEMRGLQRDALVAYILHQMGLNSTTSHIDTPDKLFEYFLMDVQMEPIIQTSRIRHALLSVQLFIERCLMNLETEVKPSSIDAKQWEWMSRYRVWEANRKVFLFPENWLEPELRDDQSPFFKETMSELLQSDITEDTAATALLNYLSKLEEVAKLEPCGIHYFESDTIDTEDDIAHVVARTSGGNRKYYYRRREYGYWKPWEPIKLDIEDNPVLPVVWQGRLFIFWLRILKQSPLNTPTTGQNQNQTTLSQLDTSTPINIPPANITVQAVLCWSEYYNGKWQPAKTSDINKPTKLGTYAASGSGAFDRSSLQLRVNFEVDGLRIVIMDGTNSSSFLLYNTHSLPVTKEELVSVNPQVIGPSVTMLRPGKSRNLDTSTLIFTIKYYSDLWAIMQDSPNATNSILKNLLPDRTIAPSYELLSPWDAPFFYEDGHHVFYVTTAERILKIPQWQEYISATIAYKPDPTMPALVQPALPVDPRPRPNSEIYGSSPLKPDIGVADQSSMERFISEDTYIHRGIGSAGTIRFGDKDIGPAGGLKSQAQQ